MSQSETLSQDANEVTRFPVDLKMAFAGIADKLAEDIGRSNKGRGGSIQLPPLLSYTVLANASGRRARLSNQWGASGFQGRVFE